MVICTGPFAAAAVKVNDFVAVCAVGVVESVTLIVNVNEPAVVGLPESVPPVERLNPAGNMPEPRLQLYGVVPPLAASVVEYATLTCPAVSVEVVIFTGVTAAAMLMVNDFEAVCAVGVVESVTFIVKLNEPDAVGVPEMVPAAESVRPAGRAPELTLQLYGVVPPLAPSVAEYALPEAPLDNELVLIARSEVTVRVATALVK